ncbi:unnamed protein product [Symbiodinium necroappetens]|uniref:Uncharacterized protein n=1 Tax=Symbiodinium necroappetens TaxID=1628268 RepID=A0A812RQX7_9DINO|nr:unnamed protein product [Symbiodinium necroappetens]
MRRAGLRVGDMHFRTEVLKTLKLRYEEKSKDYEALKKNLEMEFQRVSVEGREKAELEQRNKELACRAVRLRFPQQEVAKRGPNLYEVKGRAVKLQLAPGRSGFLEPFVVDGPLKQPLDDYLSGSGRNDGGDALGRAAPVAFEWRMEADARETHAKQKLSTSPSPEKRHRRPAITSISVHEPTKLPDLSMLLSISIRQRPWATVAGSGSTGPVHPNGCALGHPPKEVIVITIIILIITIILSLSFVMRLCPWIVLEADACGNGKVAAKVLGLSSSAEHRVYFPTRPPVLVFGTVPQSPQSPGPAIPKVPEEFGPPPGAVPAPFPAPTLVPPIHAEESRAEVPAPFEPQKLLSLKELQEAFSALQSDVLSLQGELQSIRAARGDPGQQPTEASMALQSDDIAEAETDTSEDASTERSCRNLRRSWSEWSRTDKT